MGQTICHAARLGRKDWQEIRWNGQKLYAHLSQTWVHKLDPTLLLITCHNLDLPLKFIRYYGSAMLELEAQSMADILAIRWQIETFFEYKKDMLGSDHYQVMTVKAVLRFWTLIACLMCFSGRTAGKGRQPIPDLR